MRPIEAFALVIVLVIALSLYRAHRDPRIVVNLFDLVIENNRLSKLACVFWLTFLFHTWVLLRLTLDGKMTEGYITFYGMTWAAPILARIFMQPPSVAPPAAPPTS